MKIIIVGNGGAGKSTLAQKLGKDLDIPVTYVDLIVWDKEWNRLPQKDFEKKIKVVMAGKSWIIEGWGYHSNMYDRIDKADVIIHLYFPLNFCKKSILARNKEYNNRKNPFDPFEDDRLSNQYLYEEALKVVHEQYEPELRRWLELLEYSLKKIYTITSRKELETHYPVMLKELIEHKKLLSP